MRLCQDCEMDGKDVPATVTWEDPWGTPYAHLCEACASRLEGGFEAPTFDDALGARGDAQQRVEDAMRLKRGG